MRRGAGASVPQQARGRPAAGSSRPSGPSSARSCHRPLRPKARKAGVAGTMPCSSSSSTSSATLPVTGRGATLALGLSSSRSSERAHPRVTFNDVDVVSPAARVASKSWTTRWSPLLIMRLPASSPGNGLSHEGWHFCSCIAYRPLNQLDWLLARGNAIATRARRTSTPRHSALERLNTQAQPTVLKYEHCFRRGGVFRNTGVSAAPRG
jgi:hypothetical protein